MTPPASIKPDLKVAPDPDLAGRAPARQPGQEFEAHGRTDHHAREQVTQRSLGQKIGRGALQILLPVLVIAAGLAVYQYLKATKPEPPKRAVRPPVFAVNTTPVQIGAERPRLTLYGTTVAGRQVEIRALVAGQVASTSPDLRDGGKIAEGATILAIDPFNFKSDLRENDGQTAETRAKLKEFEASLAVEQSSLKFARDQLALATTDLERAEPLSKRGAVTERTVDDRRLIVNQRRQAVAQLENNANVWEARIAQQKAALERLDIARQRAAQRLAETKLSSPFNAYVTDVGAQVGRMVGVNDRVATLIDRDWIEVAFTVTDRQFGRLATGPDGIAGRTVEVRWNVGDKPLVYSAKIDRIGASVTAQAGGVQLYARVRDPTAGVGLRPGAFVEVVVPDTEFAEVARLPSTAIFNGDTVFVVIDGKLQSRKVTIAANAGADVLVRGNLKPGERVMTTRLSLPGDGVRVRDVTRQGRTGTAGKAPPAQPARSAKPETGSERPNVR